MKSPTRDLFFMLKSNDMKIVQRYVLKDFIGPIFLALLIFTFVLLSRRIDDFITIINIHGIGIKLVLTLILLLLPYLITLTLPMGLLIACLLVFSRWNSDKELLALRISGINLWNIILPLLLVGCLSTGVLLYFTLQVVPWTYSEFRHTLYRVAATLAQNLNEQSFNRFGQQLVIFVEKERQDDGFYAGMRLFYSQEGEVNQILTSQKGNVQIDLDNKTARLILYNGALFKSAATDPNHYFIGTFERWESSMPLYRFLPFPHLGDRKPREFTHSELKNIIQSELAANRHAAEYRFELSRRYSFPFASIVFILLGVSLGTFWQIKSRTLTYILGIFMIVIYWILLVFGESLGMRGFIPPELAVWIPNILLGALGIYLTWRVCRE